MQITCVTLLLSSSLPLKAWAKPEGVMLGVFKFGAGMTGTKLEWGLGTYNQPLGFTEWADSDAAGRLVHASGLATQIIVSEVILDADSIDKNDNFVRGVMAWNILNPIIYAMDYWFIRKTNREEGTFYQGDIEVFEHYSSGEAANLFAGDMAALAICQGYRFVKTQTWVPQWAKHERVSLKWQPRGASGFALNLEINF
jgi:hypothetical protein